MTGKRPPSRDALCLPPAPFRASASVPQDSPHTQTAAMPPRLVIG